MKANKIHAKNIKGRTFTYPLGAITLITGDNGVGKTAVADAIRVAMTGYCLKLGKTSSATFKLASAATMETVMSFDGGLTNAVRLSSKGGKVKKDEHLEVEFPGILSDINEYLQKTGPQRQQFLFDLASKGLEFDVATITTAIKNIRLEPHTEKAEAVIAELCQDVEQRDQMRIEQTQPLDVWLTGLQVWLKKNVSDADAVVKQMRNSMQASVALQAQDGIVSARANIDALVEDARGVLMGLNRDLTTFNNMVGNAKAAQQRRAAAEAELDRTPPMEDKAADFAVAIENARTLVSQAEAKVAEFSGLEAKVRELNRQNTELSTQEATLMAAIKSADASRSKLKNSETCEHCGAEKKHWSKAVKAELEGKSTAASEAIAKSTGDLDDVRAKIGKVRNELENSYKDLTGLNDARTALGTARISFQNATNDLQRHTAELQRVADLRAAAQRRIDESDDTPDEEQLVQSILEVIGCNTEAGSTVKELCESLTAASEKTRTELIALETEQRTAMAVKAQAQQREKAKAELEDSEIRSQVCAVAVEKMDEKLKEIIANGITSFMDKAGALTESVMGFKLEFRDGDIGYFRDGQWVSHETFSGVQEHLAYTGLSLAFAQDAPCKLVVIDELGRMSPQNKVKLLVAVELLIAKGLLDNFIGIDVASADYHRAGINHWEGMEIINVEKQ